MAWSILFIAVLFFAVRGFFLGLPGVVARLLGIVGGYFCAVMYREDLANLIKINIPNSLPDVALQVISSALLFFTALLIISLLVSMSFKTLGKIIPPLQPLFDKQSFTGKLGGAVTNSFIAAAIVLTAIWGISAFTGKTVAPEPLQSAANTLGSKLFDKLAESKDFTFVTRQQTTTIRKTSSGQQKITRGTATIISESDPEKVLNIETINETIEAINQVSEHPDIAQKFSKLMQNSDIQELAKDPEIRNMALKQLKENPEEVKKMLKNPELQQILKQLNGSQ